jgi:hypothetical protein
MLAFLIDHFWQYNFFPVHEAWYRGAAWPNVAAVLPLAVLGIVGLVYHHTILRRLHTEHSVHLKAILDVLDPDTEGGLAIVNDRLDLETPGGIRVIRDRIDEFETQVLHNGHRAEPPHEPQVSG